MNPAIIYEDRWLCVVDKPAGLACQPARAGAADVYSWAVARWGRAALHHRLDQPTSGLMLLGLDPSVDEALARAFRDHTVSRTYLAVLAGPLVGPVRWDRPLDGRPAVTWGEVRGADQGMSAVELTLQTGRFHQIRLHAAHAGAPVVGDRRHGGEAGLWWNRLALHASRLAFNHPRLGALTFESQLPSDLSPLWRAAGGPDPVRAEAGDGRAPGGPPR